jgi:hypothetical protein
MLCFLGKIFMNKEGKFLLVSSCIVLVAASMNAAKADAIPGQYYNGFNQYQPTFAGPTNKYNNQSQLSYGSTGNWNQRGYDYGNAGGHGAFGYGNTGGRNQHGYDYGNAGSHGAFGYVNTGGHGYVSTGGHGYVNTGNLNQFGYNYGTADNQAQAQVTTPSAEQLAPGGAGNRAQVTTPSAEQLAPGSTGGQAHVTAPLTGRLAPGRADGQPQVTAPLTGQLAHGRADDQAQVTAPSAGQLAPGSTGGQAQATAPSAEQLEHTQDVVLEGGDLGKALGELSATNYLATLGKIRFESTPNGQIVIRCESKLYKYDDWAKEFVKQLVENTARCDSILFVFNKLGELGLSLKDTLSLAYAATDARVKDVVQKEKNIAAATEAKVKDVVQKEKNSAKQHKDNYNNAIKGWFEAKEFLREANEKIARLQEEQNRKNQRNEKIINELADKLSKFDAARNKYFKGETDSINGVLGTLREIKDDIKRKAKQQNIEELLDWALYVINDLKGDREHREQLANGLYKTASDFLLKFAGINRTKN